MRRILKIAGTGALVVFIFLSAVWANLAIAYQSPGSSAVRIGACLVMNLIALAALVAIVRRRHWRAVLVYAAAYALLLAWSGSISASNDKNWAADVVHGITGIVDGDRLSVRNVRNFSWRTELDYSEQWEQRTYDLSKLRSLDLFLVYWMGPSIAHTIMSFGFDDGRYLDFSIELRRTPNDQYSALAGFFKTHELVFIGGDERDLMTLRTVRNEQILLYRLRTPPERARALLDWRIILTGHLPDYLYEHGAVDTRITVEELRERADVTGRVDERLSEVEFSSRIREGVPAPR